MKCVEKNGVVKRVSNERAEEVISQGWSFCNKLLWKNSPDTTWTKNNTPPNPMSDKKKYRQEKRNR